MGPNKLSLSYGIHSYERAGTRRTVVVILVVQSFKTRTCRTDSIFTSIFRSKLLEPIELDI